MNSLEIYRKSMDFLRKSIEKVIVFLQIDRKSDGFLRKSIEKVMIFLEIDNKSIDFLRKSIEQILIFLEIDRKTGPAARNRGQGPARKSEEFAELQYTLQYTSEERVGDNQAPALDRSKNIIFPYFF